MHFIITGGAGFIGSHIVDGLLANGDHVTVVDDLSTGRIENLPKHPNLTFLQKNITLCQPSDFNTPVDGIAHLAATASVVASWQHPLATHQNNLSGTVAVIQLCQALAIPRLVITSSAAVYGNPSIVPIFEGHVTDPISPYGLQKLVSEKYASLFAQQIGFSVVALRLFNVFGPRQLPNSPYSGVISIFLSAMQQGLPITIYGDGSQTRDFVFVKDIAAGFIQALTVPLQPGSATVCNLGTGRSLSLLNLVEMMQNYFPHWQPTISFRPARVGDIQHSHADISQARADLGFMPQWSIEAGLRDLIEWQAGQRLTKPLVYCR